MPRPQLVIDWKRVGDYLRAHCDGTTIAGLLGIDNDTLYKRCKKECGMGFSEFSQLKKAEGRTIVEYSLYKDAVENGGADRMFWLKNKAGWRDRQEVGINGSVQVEPFLDLIKRASAVEPEFLNKDGRRNNGTKQKGTKGETA